MKPVDVIALILASTIAFILVVVILSPLITGNQFSIEKAHIVEKLIMALMAMLALYIGAKLNGKEK